jgi:plasmid stability protein
MAHLILHDVDPEVMEELRRRADLRGRDIEAEAKTVLEDAVGFSRIRALVQARRIREGIVARGLTSSEELLRAERERR